MGYLSTLSFVAAGGAIGACLRFLISEFSLAMFGRGFPYGTLTVNIIGSFCMGAMFIALEQSQIPGSPWRALISVGMLGALTTFSTFSMDNLALLQQGAIVKLALNIILNVSLCFAAVAAGYYLFQKSPVS
ncbi:fluoride efflux transporter CrcB [Echinimonas agarilytica]|uniref:Fluoride-specific ion channel FluC n=1 Tax=Echinimonas agarilytica TaxID=1215918 RepID=A0AA41W898_9GAMM|nr:fluoride efflux transporter CrcB [Echinimonas agarilytica]MCM2680241.1 fluoride efflux transporter CrcB [Echinimonas agarilytica]